MPCGYSIDSATEKDAIQIAYFGQWCTETADSALLKDAGNDFGFVVWHWERFRPWNVAVDALCNIVFLPSAEV